MTSVSLESTINSGTSCTSSGAGVGAGAGVDANVGAGGVNASNAGADASSGVKISIGNATASLQQKSQQDSELEYEERDFGDDYEPLPDDPYIPGDDEDDLPGLHRRLQYFIRTGRIAR